MPASHGDVCPLVVLAAEAGATMMIMIPLLHILPDRHEALVAPNLIGRIPEPNHINLDSGQAQRQELRQDMLQTPGRTGIGISTTCQRQVLRITDKQGRSLRGVGLAGQDPVVAVQALAVGPHPAAVGMSPLASAEPEGAEYSR